ncbi:hypothetical protein XO64_001199 [Salmonella enterica subsp. enterica serovar Javiana]|nr:hypothetical protein [Salmonella enterica subsp. enterica serovar Javiana]EGZ4424199.1 hypothetical protein [Salmonella enterica subsp. enterica serovar Javiana]
MKITEFEIEIITIDEQNTPVKMIKVNGEICGFIRASRNNDKHLPLSLVSVDGECIGDFHCDNCISIFLARIIMLGIKPGIAEHNTPFRLLIALAMADARKKEGLH